MEECREFADELILNWYALGFKKTEKDQCLEWSEFENDFCLSLSDNRELEVKQGSHTIIFYNVVYDFVSEMIENIENQTKKGTRK